MSKKVLVISHERSGTHWLMETITSNFLMDDPSVFPAQIDLDEPGVVYADPEEMKKALQFLPSGALLHDFPLAHPFKSHHAFEFFEPIWDYVISQYHVFYMARDGRDVMTSFWRHCWRTPGVGPRTFTATQFMEAPPGPPLDRYHAKALYRSTMLKRWNAHVCSWMDEPKEGVHYVTYEDMHKDFSGEVKDIGMFMGIKPPDRIYNPKLGGITPWKGIVGSWKGLLDDTKDFWDVYDGGIGMRLLGYEPPGWAIERDADESADFYLAKADSKVW